MHRYKTVDAQRLRLEYIESMSETFASIPKELMINVDETAINYEYVPPKTLAEKGRGKNNVADMKVRHDRITAVLGITAAGQKLPILFILPGQPNGPITNEEIPSLPGEHFYVTQPNAWMDGNVWEYYVEHVLAYSVAGPSKLFVDNLKVHVNDKSVDLVGYHCGSEVCPLPKNTTSVFQPLDVGVMGPLKSIIKSKWLKSQKGVTAREKRANIINITIGALEQLNEATVVGSWKKALDVE